MLIPSSLLCLFCLFHLIWLQFTKYFTRYCKRTRNANQIMENTIHFLSACILLIGIVHGLHAHSDEVFTSTETRTVAFPVSCPVGRLGFYPADFNLKLQNSYATQMACEQGQIYCKVIQKAALNFIL